MKRYLIVAVDEPIKDWVPKFVIAELNVLLKT